MDALSSDMDSIGREARRRLLHRRRGLMQSGREAVASEKQLPDERDADWVDAAKESEDREVSGRLSEREQLEIEEIDAALDRLACGTYGVCEHCGRAVGRQRLLAIPEARYCVECSALLEATE